ncbi:uncharacterized protein C11orf98 homolog [Acomys russatus]|uniref:uncharacterized protein C11orf98 homolog n=1 Tax=Acomys russatus TaxID=60746 RepID=UPI0021E27AD3|nr:uncharacterized protein C11orf98 homolog [Acomys russatus]
MAPLGGRINHPRMEMKLFKRQRVLSRDGPRKHQVVGAVIDEGTTSRSGHESSTCINISLSGKKHRKLLQQIHLVQKEKATMKGEGPSELTRTSEHRPNDDKRRQKLPRM